MNIQLPKEVEYIIYTLEKNGYEAYAVGGCVRDSLLGHEVKDWDICTAALARQTQECFASHPVLETGLKHGTITLMLNHIPYEITTFRIDGAYTDHRRPDDVLFVTSLKDDLARRDFTINAMAYHPSKGIADFFGGIRDLQNRVLRCVGDPDKRFREDALRILRALRFSATLHFDIDRASSRSMQKNKHLLHHIAAERIACELNRLLTASCVSKAILAHLPVLTEVIPELSPLSGFEQNNRYHCYDVLRHTLYSIDHAPKDLIIRLTMLLHDIAKPACYTQESGAGHFYGHSEKSAFMAENILTRLRYDHATVRRVRQLILYHDADIIPQAKHVRRWLNKIGEKGLKDLLAVKRADAMAQSAPYRLQKLQALDELTLLTDEIILSRQCFSLKDLAVKGSDLIAAGIPEGPPIGAALDELLDMVINELLPNEKEALLRTCSVTLRGVIPR